MLAPYPFFKCENILNNVLEDYHGASKDLDEVNVLKLNDALTLRNARREETYIKEPSTNIERSK
jgi:hypothetical protein